MNRSTTHLLTGILLAVAGYILVGIGAVQDGMQGLVFIGAPIVFAGTCLVFAGVVSAGVRWALEDVHDQRMIELLEETEDAAAT